MISIQETISGNILSDCATVAAGHIIGERYRELLELAYRATFGAVELDLIVDLGVSGSVPGPVVDRDGDIASDATMEQVSDISERVYAQLSRDLGEGRVAGIIWDDALDMWLTTEEVTRQARL